jgi:hypothetical protein
MDKISPDKITFEIKVIYSPGIKAFYAGVVFGTLWYSKLLITY